MFNSLVPILFFIVHGKVFLTIQEIAEKGHKVEKHV